MKYIAEAHSRNIDALMPLNFGLIVLVFMLIPNFTRSSGIIRKVLIYSLVLFTQTSIIVMKNLVTTDLIYLTYFYIFPISMVLLCFVSLKLEYIIKLTYSFIKIKKI